MQRGRSNNFFVNQTHERQVAAIINVFAPVADDFDILHAMFDEHPLCFGNALKELVKIFFVIRFAGGATRLFCHP